MATLQSPGVAWSEVDLTTIVPGLSTTVGGFAGVFNWGPVNELRTIGNEIDLSTTFGQPDQNTFTSFFTCANFLSYTQNLLVVRAADLTSTFNATSGNQTVVIENENKYLQSYMPAPAVAGAPAANTGMFAAKYPGALGNGLKVSVFPTANANAFAQWTYAPYFNGVPGTSQYVYNTVKGALYSSYLNSSNTTLSGNAASYANVNASGANDEMHIVVVDTLGNFSATPNTVLERFAYVSKASDATNDDGTSNYYLNVIDQKSQYIRILNHALSNTGNTWSSDTTTWGLTSSQIAGNTTPQYAQGNTQYTATLTGGTTTTVSDANKSTAYGYFLNADQAPISLLMMGDASSTVTTYVLSNITSVRQDHVLFVSPQQTDVVNQVGNEATNAITTRNLYGSSSYVVMDSGWKKQFDKYNNVYRWVPLNGDIAGLCALTDYTNASWWSPAGLNRGLIKNVTQLAWSPNQAFRDNLYKNSINPVVQMTGVGTVLYGDKTMTSKPSAFDRINVRRLFILLEQSISKAAKYSLFEFNDEFTRAQFVALVDPFLRDIKGKRGIFDYQIVCDTTNNTPEVIDRNQFVGDIYIKPARAINFIQLNFVAVGTGVAFSEVVGKTGA